MEYAKQDQCTFVLLDELVCRRIYTGLTTFFIPGDAVLRAELFYIYSMTAVLVSI